MPIVKKKDLRSQIRHFYRSENHQVTSKKYIFIISLFYYFGR